MSLLECRLCYYKFDYDNKLPTVMSCGHTICKECHLYLIDSIVYNVNFNKEDYNCPICHNQLYHYNINYDVMQAQEMIVDLEEKIKHNNDEIELNFNIVVEKMKNIIQLNTLIDTRDVSIFFKIFKF